MLAASGVEVTPEALVPQVYLPGREGSLQVELVAATRRHDRVPYRLDPGLDAVLAELRAGRPVLVLQNLGLAALPVWHFAVVVGYLPSRDLMVLRSGTERRHGAPAGAFLKTWERAGRWAVVALRPGELPARADPDRYLRAVAAMEGVAAPRAVLAAYEAGLARWPEDARARFGLANALAAAGRAGEAEAALEALLGAEPDHAAALNNLAVLLAGRGCGDRARRVIARALTTPAGAGALRPALLETRSEIEAGAGAGAGGGRCEAPPRP